MADEIWKSIPSAPSYEASSYGRIRRAAPGKGTWPGRVLAQCVGSRWGYPLVNLQMGGYQKTCKVHRLVCEAFHGPPPPGKPHVAHYDGVRTNAASENLRWANRADNAADMIRHGTSNPRRGSANSNSKLTEQDVAAIRAAKRYRGMLDDLAARYGVSRNVVGNIRSHSNNCWPHVHAHPPASNAD